MTWWESRRIGWRRYEVRPHPSCLGSLVYGTAAVVVGAGALVRIAPLLLDQARVHAGAIALTVAAVALLAGATRSPP